MYCKLNALKCPLYIFFSINSSKVYCKFCMNNHIYSNHKVLIVAKCIVNLFLDIKKAMEQEVLIVAKCIVNKTPIGFLISLWTVLIVAKCIVNISFSYPIFTFIVVLIVAKCIVNSISSASLAPHLGY